MNSFFRNLIFKYLTVKREINDLDTQERALLIYFLHTKYKKRKIRIYKRASKRLIDRGILKVVDSEVKPGSKLVKVSDKYYLSLKKFL
ncbi:hypothetical protein C9446_11410 [Providencia heimbachae]|nr:hypothetical protein [Providencia heimbachae]QCJ70408.1 hypothetical protein C9446_11410 [Providencia heimbachae]